MAKEQSTKNQGKKCERTMRRPLQTAFGILIPVLSSQRKLQFNYEIITVTTKSVGSAVMFVNMTALSSVFFLKKDKQLCTDVCVVDCFTAIVFQYENSGTAGSII